MSNQMILVGFFVILLCCFAGIDAKHLPPFIKPCKKDDPQFNECAMKNAQEAIPFIIKGDPARKIPNLDPFFLPLVETSPSNGLSFKLKNLTLTGLYTARVEKFNLNFDKRRINITLHLDKAITVGVYEVDGKVLTLQITGSGPANITSEDTIVNCIIDYNMKTVDGKDYIDVNALKILVDYHTGKTHYEFGNLFNGDKALGDNFNKVLNENTDAVDETSQKVNVEVMSAIVLRIFQTLLRGVPFNEIFL